MKTLLPAVPANAREIPVGIRVASAREAIALLSPLAKGLEREHVWRLDLDARNRVLACETIAMGAVDRVLVTPREVYRDAVRAGAEAIMLAHNHPTGEPTPSLLDKKLTKRLALCGLLLGIELVDHVILCDERAFSFREEGSL